MDAVGAIELLGYGDRAAVKNALSASLAKSEAEKQIFDSCFERFFAPGQSIANPEPHGAPSGNAHDAESIVETTPLSRMLLSDDWTGIAVALGMAFEAMDVESLRYLTQRGQNVRRILERLQFEDIGRDIERLRQGGSSGSAETAEALQRARDELYGVVRDYVQRQFALFAPPSDEEFYFNSKLPDIDERHYQRMQTIITKMVKQLNALYARRRTTARVGLLDFKKTLRVNLANQGVLFDTRWRKKKPDRPDVIAICDISRSVRHITRFFLLFLYGLTEIVARIRTFLFCSNLGEASHIFESYPLEEAIARIENNRGFRIRMGMTDYGRALSDFKEHHMNTVSHRTTVFIIGDARNNYDDPRAEILGLIRQRCRRIVWLNPESPLLWQTGDSVMSSFLPYCHVARECNTLNHLMQVAALLCRTPR
jgi:hypothetical protein